LNPWGELVRLVRGILRPDFLSVEAWSVVWTVAFAVIGVGIGAASGLLLAIAFPHFAAVRASALVLRSIHELFWALLLIQVFGLGPMTGVLAIAAAKALRQPVVASDIDSRAITIARDNARSNRVGTAVAVIHAAGVLTAPFRARAPYGLIFANILLDPLKALATPTARLVAPNGLLVLSGLLAAQAGAALASYRARGLALVRRVPLEGWATLILVRSARSRRATRGRTGV